MFELFAGLDSSVGLLLLVSVGLVLAFEFINGFHDTANAVATVIYTQSMKPHHAVIASGIFNFLGVMAGGLAVAYAIVNLLPADLLISVNSTRGLVMVFALLCSAIIWNLGTWYFGIPASSSHTLIGSIVGVGMGHALLTGQDLSTGVNWSKAIDVFLSLLMSPLVGGGLAALLLWLMLKLFSRSNIHKTPFERQQIEGKKRPPFWARFMLIVSAMGMSFSHGSNDGQKGVGLLMLVLIGIVPAQFMVNLDSSSIQIERTRDAALHIEQFYQQRSADAARLFPGQPNAMANGYCQPADVALHSEALLSQLNNIKSYRELNDAARAQTRTHLFCLADAAKKAEKLPNLSAEDKKYLKELRSDLTESTEYAPTWVIVAIALAIGIGTMVGWRRVVHTVGEKIGKKDMTYAQGMAAQTMAAAAIGLASVFGFPVSTTQVLSSAVAGTMVAGKAGLQMSTLRTILMTWILTLPVTMLLAIGFYYLGVQLFV